MADLSPITAAFTGAAQTTTTMTPARNRGFNVSISGVFVGTVSLDRQLVGDGGGTWRSVTTWTAPVESSVTEVENGTKYRMSMTAFTSGTANVRLGQSY